MRVGSLKALKLNRTNQLILSTSDISRILGISIESSRVTASRYVSKGLLVRLKRDMYIPMERFRILEVRDQFRIANLLQTPSYVSLTTALSYWGISTQQQQNFVESIALKRTKTVVTDSHTFTYSLIKEACYNGFEQKEDFFIATAEKAMADCVYLTSLGRYTLDIHAIDFSRIDMKKMQNYIDQTNRITKSYWVKLCELYES